MGHGARSSRLSVSRVGRPSHPMVDGGQRVLALAVGDFPPTARTAMARAASRASVEVRFAPSVPAALELVRQGDARPLCLLAAADADPARCIAAVHDDLHFFALPTLVLVPRPTARDYQGAAAAGADDVLVAGDDGGLTRRLANLAAFDPASLPTPTLGRVAVASPDVPTRRKLGRPLRRAGFDVHYVAQLSEIDADPTLGPLVFAVATMDAGPEDGPPLEGRPERTAAGVPLLWLRAQDIEASGPRVGDRLGDATSRMLFFADEQRSAAYRDGRSSSRRLHATVCTFRPAGLLEGHFGLTHNVSAEGMYIRSLDPPAPDTPLWIELAAPVTVHPVHLRAVTVWRRLPGVGGGVLPPGFGLRLLADECPPGDFGRYLGGYHELGI